MWAGLWQHCVNINKSRCFSLVWAKASLGTWQLFLLCFCQRQYNHWNWGSSLNLWRSWNPNSFFYTCRRANGLSIKSTEYASQGRLVLRAGGGAGPSFSFWAWKLPKDDLPIAPCSHRAGFVVRYISKCHLCQPPTPPPYLTNPVIAVTTEG